MHPHNDNAPGSPALHGQGSEGADKEERTMAGNRNSGRPPSPRALRELATLDMCDTHHELHELAGLLVTLDRVLAHAQRRLAHAATTNTRAHLRVIRSHERDDAPYQGIERRTLARVA